MLNELYFCVSNDSDHQFQGVEGGFPTLPSNSQIPAGRPTIQLNSDIIHLERASDATG